MYLNLQRELSLNFGEICRQHYVEYLGKLVFKHEIDPVPILEQDELEIILKRAGKRLPSRYGITPDIWKEKLLNVITNKSTLFSLLRSSPTTNSSFSGIICYLMLLI